MFMNFGTGSPAVAEGHIGSAALPLSIRQEDVDPETGKYQFPDAPLMARLRAALAKQSGIPVHTILTEQEKRLPPVLPETTWRLMPSQPRQPSRQRPAGRQTSTAVQTRQPLPQERQTFPQPDGHPERVPPPVSPAEPPQKVPERMSDGQKPAGLRHRHRIV